MSDYKGAALMINAFPKADVLLGDRGYDADWFRQALIARGITPCIPSKTNRKVPIPHDRALYRQRHRVENMFGKIKDWRRITPPQPSNHALHRWSLSAAPPATTAAPTPSCQPSASLQPSSSGSINES